MKDRKLVMVLLVAGGVLVLAAAALFAIYRPGLEAPPPSPTPTPPPPPPLNITLPPSLAELSARYPRLAPILDDPALDSVYKDLLLAYQEGGTAAALELARQRGLLTDQGDIRVALILDTEDSAPLVAQLEAIGVTVVSAYRDRINIAVPLALIEAEMQSEEPGAIFARLSELEHVIAVRLPEQRAPNAGTIDGEGIALVNADDWHAAGVTGAGVRVGILDLGFAGHQELLGSELPANVTVSTFGWVDDRVVHGTACAEIIHELAPDAELVFAWYDGSDAAMGQAVDWLLAQRVQIISHSASGLIGPRDGSEWDAQLVDRVAAQGVLWVNSAGNQALSHYRATFNDEDGDGRHEFAPGQDLLALDSWSAVRIALNWEDTWGAAQQDLDLYLYDRAGNLLASSRDLQSGQAGQEPVEWIRYDPGGQMVYVVIVAQAVSQPVIFDLFADGADLEIRTPDHSLCPPADAVGSLTVGAANWWDDSLASYSSQGPTADGRFKPEISAPTSVSNYSYGGSVVNNEGYGFNGTSAACPHVAGAAALVWQAHPEFGRQEVVDFLLANAVDRGVGGPDTGYGYGRLQLPELNLAGPAPTFIPPPTLPPSLGFALPTPTPVVYALPQPTPSSGGITISGAALALVGCLACSGTLLLFIGGVMIVAMGLRSRRRRVFPSPPPHAPSSPPPRVPSPPAGAAQGRCPHCGAALRPGVRFCPTCGRSLEASPPRRCAHCGAELREGARFCAACGKPV